MNPRWVVPFLAALFLLTTAMRYPDTLYMEDIPDQAPILLKVIKVAGIYSDPHLGNRLVNAMPDEEVQVLAIGPKSYQVTSTQKRFMGWIDPTTLNALKPETVQELKARLEEEKSYQTAIKNKQAISGMTPVHVQKALGKPNKVTSRKDETGSFEVWSYIITEPIYQDVLTPVTTRDANGNPYTTSVPMRQKVGEREVSSTTIEFKNGRVTAIENSMTEDRNVKSSVTKNQTNPSKR